MGSFTGYFNDAAAAGTAGYGLYRQIDRALNASKSRCHFIRNNVAEVQFDVTLQEAHSFQTQPTEFPVDRGATVTDHIFSAPVELSLTGLISDHPTEDPSELITQTITGIGTALATQAGFGGAGALAATVGYTSLAATARSYSRSAAMFNKLQSLAGVQVPGASPVRPAVFDVVTVKEGKAFRRYPDMCIKTLQLQRDNTTGPTSLVFSITLGQVRYAYAKTTILRSAIPYKAQAKTQHGEADNGEPTALEKGGALGDKSGAANFVRSANSAVRQFLGGED